MELTPAYGHNPAVNAPPESYSLSNVPDRAVFPRDAYATAHTKPCGGILRSIPDDTCIPIACGLNSLPFPLSLFWFVNLSRSRPRRLHLFSGTVKLWESPGKAGVLPEGNYLPYS